MRYPILSLLVMTIVTSACTTTKKPEFFTPESYAAQQAAKNSTIPKIINETQFRKMLTLAEQGDARAQYYVGLFYHQGIVADKNRQLAFKWFQKSALNNDPLGAYKTGAYYSDLGKGFIATDENKALEYKLLAAKAGYYLAQYDVATILIRRGSIDEGIEWLKAAGEQGDLRSLYALFNIYSQHDTASADLPAAYLYLRLAMKVATDKAPAQVEATLQTLKKTIAEAEQEKVDRFVSGWQPQSTAITLEAERGIQGAKDYLTQRNP